MGLINLIHYNKDMNMNQTNHQNTSTFQIIQPFSVMCAGTAVNELIDVLNQIIANPLNPLNLTQFLRAVATFTAAVTISCPIDVAKKLVSCVNDNGFINIPGIINCLGSIKPNSVFRAYITGGSNNIDVCTVDPATGTLSALQEAGGSGFNLPYGIALDAKGQHAYITNYYNDTVSLCTIDETTGKFSTCQTAGNRFFHRPTDIVVVNLSNNPATTFAYIIYQNQTIAKCTIEADGTLNDCESLSGGFYYPRSIAFNTLSTYAYVLDGIDAGVNKVLVCTVDPVTGELNACREALESQVGAVSGIAINKVNGNAYVVNRYNSNLLQCSIKPDGTFASCHPTGSGFAGARSIAIINDPNNPSTAFLYVMNQGNDTISTCTIEADGTLSNCQAMKLDFTPLDIAFHG
ncbi:hypothetical protein RICGR_1246 [Rickettsiella grylli]|uniref:Uncharacterized protein n=2 Tax=Rickettsiella grylli TaxID=59196 RepID=A8PPA4_9COXI|nr:hypothetical protein RICGR_1246 [Rickettsiella grylli]